MHAKLAMFLVLAGGVAACSSPPPPPMAMAPEPAPMPAPMPAPRAAARGAVYRGTVEASADNPATCRHMGPAATARVNGRTAVIGGTRMTVGADGALSGGRRGPAVTGTLANGTIDATTKVGNCSYHYVLNQA